ncbi:hypothetical protein OUZ56_013296 [Daphnia magna]|uniref:Uncharacterized protein n=1 Tax=Daphnia magna TaxID=35525 RepID=A0ABQ9Z5G8_9CRUS|nr:hypothetical protein OUZ56_013296 [Daphnia magna]
MYYFPLAATGHCGLNTPWLIQDGTKYRFPLTLLLPTYSQEDKASFIVSCTPSSEQKNMQFRIYLGIEQAQWDYTVSMSIGVGAGGQETILTLAPRGSRRKIPLYDVSAPPVAGGK